MIGIIILNWNGYSDSSACIDSILSLKDDLNYLLYLVDNNSQDDSFERLQSKYYALKNITFIQTGENLGYAKGNNYGINSAINDGCEFICVLNNDVIVCSNTIESLLMVLIADRGVGIVGGKVYFEHERNQIWAAGGDINLLNGSGSGIGYKSIDSGRFDREQEVGYIPGALFLSRSKVLTKLNLLPEVFFLGGEEIDLGMRIKKLGMKVSYTPKSICFHKVGYSGNRSIKYIYNRFRNRLLIIRRNYNIFGTCLGYTYFVFKNIVITGVWGLRKKEKRNNYRAAKKALFDHVRYSEITLQHIEEFESTIDNSA